jgi:methionine transaminase
MPTFPSAISSKLPQVGTSIFAVMSALANKHGALNLSQGFPGFSSSPELIDLVTKYMKQGLNQYAPMPGVPVLRERIVEKYKKLYGVDYDVEKEVTVTSGATQALYSAISAVVKEGDEVIIFTPAYDSYQPAIELSGGKTVFVQLKHPNYSIDWSEVKKLVNRKTRMIIINNPHNPAGACLSDKDLKSLDKLTMNTDIIVLSDEVYEHIVFDGKPHLSVGMYPNLASRSFIVASFGKTFHNTGWKLGYCLAPSELMKEFRKVHQYLVFSSNTPMQYAIAEYMSDESNYLSLPSFYQQKRDLFLEAVAGSAFKPVPCAGTYFQLLDYSAISDEKDTDMAIRLTKEYKIASIPISVFYNKEVDNKVLRFCFAKDEDTLKRAGDVLRKVVG